MYLALKVNDKLEQNNNEKRTGSLTVVGTGIKLATHITVEAKGYIQQADHTFMVANSTFMIDWIRSINPTAESLHTYYKEGTPRQETYEQMVDHILAPVRQGKKVCAVFYGHPGIFVWPGHQAIARAKAEGHKTRMLPGISAEDCLFADLSFDPSTDGCQSYEATDFLVRPRRFDTSTGLILWQIGVIDNLSIGQSKTPLLALSMLIEKLQPHYGLDHEVIVYEAAILPGYSPQIQPVPLGQLSSARLTPASTLYIPPTQPAAVDRQIAKRLGLPL